MIIYWASRTELRIAPPILLVGAVLAWQLGQRASAAVSGTWR
jgi:hypothetical protein